MKVVVNKCPHTGRFYEDDREYARHMRKMQKMKRHDAERVAFMKHFDEFVVPMYLLRSFEEISEWLTENYWTIARHFGYRCNRWGYDHIYRVPDPRVDKVRINLMWMKWDEKIPTYHQTPRGQHCYERGRYYDYGWKGDVKIEFEGQAYEFFCTDHLKMLNVNTSSGGGGPKNSSYGCYLFGKDFPKMMAQRVYEKMIRV